MFFFLETNLTYLHSLGRRGLLASLVLAFASLASQAAELRVITSGAFTEAYKKLVPIFEAASGHTVVSAYGASIGNAPDAIPTRFARGEKFDLVLAMEVVEHVADVPLFVRSCGDMVKPGGMMIAATLNRTLKSFALAIVGAEYILRWLPPGTHQWDKFVTPNELEIAMEQAGLSVTDERGVVYNPLADAWRLSSDTDVNYMLAAEKA